MRTLTALLLASALGACSAAEEQGPACDRACLVDLTGKYVADIEGKSIEGIPFSDEAVIVENLKRINAGEGLWAEQIAQTFAVFQRRYGLDRPSEPLSTDHFRRPLPRSGQMRLFDA